MAGLIELARSPRELSARFESLTFVESGFPSGKPKLIDHYNKAASELKRNADEKIIVPTEFTDRAGVTIHHFDAAAGVKVSYFGPPEGFTEKTGPHGLALITLYTISGPNGSTKLVDFDDASSARTTAWLQEYGKEVKQTGVRSLAVIPHHGSDAEKIDAIIEAQFDGCIISVDAFNEYRHPGPKNLLKLVKHFGREKVTFTGAEGNILVNAGEIPAPHRNFNKIFESFILPQRQYLELELRLKEEALLGALKAGDQKNAKRAEGGIETALESLKAAYELETIYTEKPIDPAQIAALRYEIPHQTVLKHSLQNNVGTWQDLEVMHDKRMEHRYGAEKRAKDPVRSYVENENYLPIAGGVVAGGIVENAAVKPLSAIWNWVNPDEAGQVAEKAIELLIETDRGTCRYDLATYTEFHLAQNLVAQNDIILVSGNYDKDRRHFFDVNPVIVNTLVAWYAMQLDLFMEQEVRFRIAHDADFKMPAWKKLVWIDQRSTIQLRSDRLEVVAASDGSDMLYRIMIKNYNYPDWWIQYQAAPKNYLTGNNPELAQRWTEYDTAIKELRRLEAQIELSRKIRRPNSSGLESPFLDPASRNATEEILRQRRESRLPSLDNPESLIVSYSQKVEHLKVLEKELNRELRIKEMQLRDRHEVFTWDNAYLQSEASTEFNNHIQTVAREFVALRRINDFAKTVHVLRWLKTQGISLSPLAGESPLLLNTENNLTPDDYLPENILSLRGRNKLGAISLPQALDMIKPEPVLQHNFPTPVQQVPSPRPRPRLTWILWIITPVIVIIVVSILSRLRRNRS